MKNRIWIVVGVALLVSGRAFAEVKVNALFSDNAVLQQGQPVPVWGTADNGEKVTVSFAGQTAETVAKDGKWKVLLPALEASTSSQTMTISGANKIEIKNLLVGEVWVCSGQSNMAFPIAPRGRWRTGVVNSEDVLKNSNDPLLRLFRVPTQTKSESQSDVGGKWSECSSQTLATFSAVGYFFGRDLRKSQNVPVGLINASVGGSSAEQWTSREALEANPALRDIIAAHEKAIQDYSALTAKQKTEEPAPQEKPKADDEQAKAADKPSPGKRKGPGDPTIFGPACLYNAMIAPLQPFAIKGVIWYQGESNDARAKQYQTLFPTLIACWRNAWGQGEFPFLFAQITPNETMHPEIREAQLVTWQKTPNTAMVVTTDHGAAKDIHPREKEPVGARLARAARAIAYGEKIEYSGPVFKSLTVEGNKAMLSFTHVDGGLVAKDGELKGFTIASADKKFVPATAKIDGDMVVVNSAGVAHPVAVRYGWANVPDVNLFNKADLPATPFRSDAE